MAVQDFLLELLALSTHHGEAGRALQEYALGVLQREVADLEFLSTGEEPARYFSTIYYGETVSRREAYGEFFKLDRFWISHVDVWRARLQHVQTWVLDPARARQQAALALIDMERRHGLEGARQYLQHLWGGGWLLDLEHAAQLLWSLKRAEVAEIDLAAAHAEMEFIGTQAMLGDQSLIQTAASWTTGRYIPSPVYERHAGSWFGLANMRLLRSRDNLGRMSPYLDVIHDEALLYNALRYFLQECYLLANPYLRTLERFIEENDERCDDCEQLLRLGPRAPQFARVVQAINQERWEEAQTLVDPPGLFGGPLLVAWPDFLKKQALALIKKKRPEGDRLNETFLESLSVAQRLSIEFGWRTAGVADAREADAILREMPRPY